MNINDTLHYQHIGLPEDIRRRKEHGDFAGAVRLIDLRLQDKVLPKALRYALQVHREMLLRLPEEYPYSREDALSIIRGYIPEYTEAELDALIDTRRIRWIYIDGRMRIFNRFFSSVCKAMPDFARRAGVQLPGVESATSGSQADSLLDVSMRRMKESGSLSARIRIRATVKMKDANFVPGMFVRAHLPIPAACQQQSDIRIEKLFPENGRIAPEDAPQRTVCWEETMGKNHEFMVEYSYLHTASYTDAYHGKGVPGTYDFDVEEQAPHIVFSPYIKALCAELTEGMTDPDRKSVV